MDLDRIDHAIEIAQRIETRASARAVAQILQVQAIDRLTERVDKLLTIIEKNDTDAAA